MKLHVFGPTWAASAAAVVWFLTVAGGAASAQNWSFDARKVGMGSPTGAENIASKMVEDEREYGTIVLPFGLIQVLRDFDRLNPSKDEFDLVRAVEYSASPIHHTVGRNRSDSQADEFIADVGNGEMNRDLNVYKGFVPVNQPRVGGIVSPTWGKTFRLRGGADGPFHGIYVGAGPYVSMLTAPAIDPRLVDILGSDATVYVSNAQLTMHDTTQGQVALAVAGGYRGRFAWPEGVGAATERDGLYVGAQYRYLRGFRYEDLDLRLRMDTDDAGLLTVNAALPPPLLVTRVSAESGRGMAVDVGAAGVMGPWKFGVGANGIGNRIDWSGVERTPYLHADLVSGRGDLAEGETVSQADVRVKLPVEYRTNVTYQHTRWTAVAEFGHGLQGASFHGGGEYRLSRLDLRAGAVYSRELWNPAAGLGLGITPGLALDLAVYSNSANIERKRNPAIAVSLRLSR